MLFQLLHLSNLKKSYNSFRVHIVQWPSLLLKIFIFTIIMVVLLLPTTTEARLGPHHPGGSIRKVHSSSHHHHVPTKGDDGHTQKITSDRQLLQDKEHLKEDLGEWVFADGKEMQPEEMEFYYFKMHDFDNNTQLDGLEILQALMHVLPIDETEEADDAHTHKHAVSYESSKKAVKLREDDFNYYIDLIDTVLEQDDLNHDGLLSYTEYVVGRRKLEKDATRSPIF